MVEVPHGIPNDENIPHVLEVYVQMIESVVLPNYLESTLSEQGWESREAPLAAKYKVDLLFNNTSVELFFEIRLQPHGDLVDEYYEDQVYDALMAQLSSISDREIRSRTYTKLFNKIAGYVYHAFKGGNIDFPIPISVEF